MILGVDILKKLVEEKNLVTNLCERERTNPEGAGFDLRLGEVYRISGEAYLGETERKTADIVLVEKYVEGEKRAITVQPGEFFLIKTIEKLNTPKNLSASITPRGTTYRSGIMIRTGNGAPGYCGELTFAMSNVGPVPVTIEMGARIVHIQFFEVQGEANSYRGQWQGGRVSAIEKETQI